MRGADWRTVSSPGCEISPEVQKPSAGSWLEQPRPALLWAAGSVQGATALVIATVATRKNRASARLN